jgi:hypothetical protein
MKYLSLHLVIALCLGLGKKMAVLEIKLYLVTVLTEYDIEPIDKMPQVDTTKLSGTWPTVLPMINVKRKELTSSIF